MEINIYIFIFTHISIAFGTFNAGFLVGTAAAAAAAVTAEQEEDDD